VLIGTASAPIRAAAKKAATHSGPFGNRIPIRAPLPTPLASSARASSADSLSACA
jgi:hypothetical protein